MRIGPQQTRTIGAVAIDEAIDLLRRHGFHEHDREQGGAVLKKPGARFSPRAHQRPLEATLTALDGEGLALTLRYDQFVAFDTGELARNADRLVRALRAASES